MRDSINDVTVEVGDRVLCLDTIGTVKPHDILKPATVTMAYYRASANLDPPQGYKDVSRG